MPNNSNRWFSIGVWDGATDNHNNLAQLVENWSTKFGFYWNKI